MPKTRIPRFRIACIAMLLLAGPAQAHTPGLSMADFEVDSRGRVEARLTFASAELLEGVDLDRDRDGVVTPEDVTAARADLRVFAEERVGVEADGTSCAASFRDGSLTEADGLLLQATYTCPSDAAEIEVTLYYLSAPTRGPPHKSIARIVEGNAKAEGVLTGEHRAIALRRPGTTHAAAHGWARLGAFGTGAILVAFLAWSSSRWRQARAAWQNRPP